MIQLDSSAFTELMYALAFVCMCMCMCMCMCVWTYVSTYKGCYMESSLIAPPPVLFMIESLTKAETHRLGCTVTWQAQGAFSLHFPSAEMEVHVTVPTFFA